MFADKYKTKLKAFQLFSQISSIFLNGMPVNCNWSKLFGQTNFNVIFPDFSLLFRRINAPIARRNGYFNVNRSAADTGYSIGDAMEWAGRGWIGNSKNLSHQLEMVQCMNEIALNYF